MDSPLELLSVRNLIVGYFVIGAAVCFTHPLLRRGLRETFTDLKHLDLPLVGAIFLKPLIGLWVLLFSCLFWPIAWFNVGKSEKKAQQAADAQLERLRPFAQVYSKMNAPVTYAGGDGSSFQQAVILVGANLLSGPRAEHDFVGRRYPGYEFHKQSLEEQGGRTYDVLEFTTAGGETKRLFFDISGHIQPHQ